MRKQKKKRKKKNKQRTAHRMRASSFFFDASIDDNFNFLHAFCDARDLLHLPRSLNFVLFAGLDHDRPNVEW